MSFSSLGVIGVRPGGSLGSFGVAEWGWSGSISVGSFIWVSSVFFMVFGLRPVDRRDRSGSMASL